MAYSLWHIGYGIVVYGSLFKAQVIFPLVMARTGMAYVAIVSLAMEYVVMRIQLLPM